MVQARSVQRNRSSEKENNKGEGDAGERRLIEMKGLDKRGRSNIVEKEGEEDYC